MITVERAQELISKNVRKSIVRKQSIDNVVNLFLAEDIISRFDIPMFNQSAMDGYAFKFADKDESLTVINEVAAGDVDIIGVEHGEAVRIFTGSKIPDSCDTVVMQELTERNGNKLKMTDSGLKFQGNVRIKGNQLRKGDVALKRGTRLTPASIGFLATIGVQEVLVFQKPSVCIIATGNELMSLGSLLKDGQIFESNTYMLNVALQTLGIEPTITVVKDNRHATENTINDALERYDLIIITGGISVGDYDFVKESLLSNQVEEVFHKINQKPGKPMFFGVKGNKSVFALPGNPAAALSCFYMYVYPYIRLTMGAEKPFLPLLKLPLMDKYIKKEGRAVFLKAIIKDDKAVVLNLQESDALQSFSMADGLIYLAAEIEIVEQNTLVDFFLLP